MAEERHNVTSAESESEMSNYDCKNCPVKFKEKDEQERHIDVNLGRKISKKKQRNKKK